MQQPRLTEFSGVAGQVLQRSVSAASLISGIVLCFVLLVGNWVLVHIRAPEAASAFTQLVFTLAMARFAVNGQFGEWSGTIFSCVGGSWFTVARVAGRYLAMTALWLVPMMIFGSLDQNTVAMIMMTGAGAAKLATFIMLYVLAMMLTPPVLLIVAVGAGSFADLFSSAHWRRLFSGRLGDLFAVYVVYAGGVGMVVVLSIPMIGIGFSAGSVPGWLTVGASFCLLLGLSANLLGRLCGFYACGDLGADETSPEAETPSLSGHSMAAGSSVVPPRPATSGPAVVPVSAAAPVVPGAEVGSGAPASVGAGAGLAAPVGAAAPVAAAALAAPESKLPPLLESKQRIAEAMRRYDRDPAGAISALEELRRSYAPCPQVIQALCLCKHRAGEVDEAVALAKEVIPICFERGHVFLAAEIYRELRAQLDRLELNRDQILAIAASLSKKDDAAAAARAYSVLISADPGEIRAVKGLLQVAETTLHKKAKPRAAAKIFRYLLQHCADSPLAEYMTRGLEEAERAMGKTG